VNAALPRDLSGLQKWAARNFLEQSLGKCCVLPRSGRGPAVVQDETHGLGSISAVLVGSNGHGHQRGALWPWRLTRAWMVPASQWREGLLHHYMAPTREHPQLSPILGHLVQEKFRENRDETSPQAQCSPGTGPEMWWDLHPSR